MRTWYSVKSDWSVMDDMIEGHELNEWSFHSFAVLMGTTVILLFYKDEK